MIRKPYKHQTVSLKHDEQSDVVFDCSEPGTGKTAVRIWGFEKRHKRHKKAMLVLCPRSLMESVWRADVKKFAPGLRVSVANAANRDAAFKLDADVYVTNHDAVKWIAKQKKVFFDRFSELTIDESTAFKHSTSQRSRAIAKIAKHFAKRNAMTGTPNTVSITDVWHQVYILDYGRRLGPTFYGFRNSVCTPEQIGRNEKAINWVDKEGAEEAVFNLLDDIVIRHKLDDCADIPPNHHYTVPFILPPKQQRAYDDMEERQILTLSVNAVAARISRGNTAVMAPPITAVNAASVTSKLLQISSGAVYSSPDVYEVIDTTRYEMIMDMVEARKHPLILFLWKHQRDLLVREAESRGMTFAVLDGESTDLERKEVEQAYQRGLYDCLFGHPKTVAHGYTFTRGTSTIWASPTQNLEWYDQGSRRQRRLGQTEKTETITVLAENPVEQAVYADLQAKDGRMSNLLSLFETLRSKYE